MARNYIAAEEFQIAGLIAHSNSPNDPDHRLIKGSGGELRRLLRFPTIYTRGLTPKYYFRFVAYKLKEAAREKTIPTRHRKCRRPTRLLNLRSSSPPPPASCRNATLIPRCSSRNRPSTAACMRRPSLRKSRQLYVNVTDRTTQAPLNVQISCVTPGIYLRVAENQNPNDWNVAIEQEPGQNGILPMGQPMIIGSEKYDKQQIAGPSSRIRRQHRHA